MSLCPPSVDQCRQELKQKLHEDMTIKKSAADVLRMVMDEF